nr:O-antigen ligase family protein [Qipengyuania mesophila]
MWVAGVLLSLGCVLTQSRSSLALLILVLIVLAARALWYGRLSAHRPKPVLLGSIGIALVLALGILATNARTLQTIERFEDLEDSRPDIWADTLVAVDRYWPVGSGMGTFDEVFQVDESLETLVAPKAGRAHNDFLEISLEAGVPGILLVLAWLVWLGIAWWRTRGGESGTLAGFSALALLCVALQSLIDYPLRNYAMWSLVAGFAAVLATANINSRGLNLVKNP